MSTPKQAFTKGPWRTGDVYHTVFGPPNGQPCPKIIATVSHDQQGLGRGREETIANARLIAQAPAMYEALEADLHDLQEIANYVRGLDGQPDDVKHVLNLIGGRIGAIESTLAKALQH